MGSVLKFFKSVAAILVFCVGLYLLVNNSRTYIDMVGNVRDKLKDNELYQQYYAEDVETLSYATLISTLFQTLEYDVMIDGTIIIKADHSVDRIAEYGIRNVYYKKSYRYDEDGDITMIIYTSVS